ncbi:fibrillarin-like rRNA/tRNA 2'-O-methyltransferase [Candidatus Woesearchaeota archaeon]|nr:fibrillarin-like rRNA/tRNA 2'-O-methyltransferase [Candidatus Woesearchaeota archaeon]
MKQLNYKFPGIFVREKRKGIYTINAIPGKRVYDERLFKEGKTEYRQWDPERSKLSAALTKGISQTGITENSLILYLGSASGTTVSHLSDICTKGFIFAVEFAPRVMRDFIFMCEKRKNIAPFLESANHPENYSQVPQVDVLYQDIAQRDQVGIFMKNYDKFLKKGGFGLLAIKARSIDVTKKPKQIFKQVMDELNQKTTVVDYRVLDPYEKDHAFFVVKKK